MGERMAPTTVYELGVAHYEAMLVAAGKSAPLPSDRGCEGYRHPKATIPARRGR